MRLTDGAPCAISYHSVKALTTQLISATNLFLFSPPMLLRLLSLHCAMHAHGTFIGLVRR